VVVAPQLHKLLARVDHLRVMVVETVVLVGVQQVRLRRAVVAALAVILEMVVMGRLVLLTTQPLVLAVVVAVVVVAVPLTLLVVAVVLVYLEKAQVELLVVVHLPTAEVVLGVLAVEMLTKLLHQQQL
jgi:hypothetical protein